MSETVDTHPVLMVAGVPNEHGRSYSAQDLGLLAAKFPEKLFFEGGKLHSKTPLEDDQHLFRWSVTIAHHVEQAHIYRKHEALTNLLSAFKRLQEELQYRNVHTGKLVTLHGHEHEKLTVLRDELNAILEDQHVWAGLQDT